MDLDKLITKYKPYELDFVVPDPNGDVKVYLDLYLMYESKDPEWHEVQAIIFEYLNTLLVGYRSKKISKAQLIDLLYFPEVEAIGFGYCKEGVSGSGTSTKRAQLIKKAIFDDPKVQQFGIETLAKTSIQIEGIGPDLLSDLVANFALLNLIKYTEEQVKTFGLKTMTVGLARAYDARTKKWISLPKVNLPYFSNGEQRILVPRHISRRMPILSTSEFYKGFLKYILQDEEIARRRILSTFGEIPKVKIKEIEKGLEKDYESVGLAARKIAKERPDLVKNYAENPHKFDIKRKPRKSKIDWRAYSKELKEIPTGIKFAKAYAEFLRKVFRAMYGDNLLRGKMETKSVDGVYRYDVNFLNASETAFLKIVRSQQLKAGLLIIESKNYAQTTEVANKEFNQSLSYGIINAREVIFLVKREPITQADITRSKSIFLRHKIVVLPMSDEDIIKMLELRHISEMNFDEFLNDRLQEILSA